MQARMRQMFLIVVVVVALAVVFGSTAFAQTNPLIGTWTLNVAKSTLTGTPPASLTRLVEAWDADGVKGTGALVRADGTRANEAFTAHYDGMDYRLTGRRVRHHRAQACGREHDGNHGEKGRESRCNGDTCRVE